MIRKFGITLSVAFVFGLSACSAPTAGTPTAAQTITTTNQQVGQVGCALSPDAVFASQVQTSLQSVLGILAAPVNLAITIFSGIDTSACNVLSNAVPATPTTTVTVTAPATTPAN